MTQRQQDDIRLPQLSHRLRMREIPKQLQLRTQARLVDSLDNFGIHLAGKTDFQTLSKVRRLGT